MANHHQMITSVSMRQWYDSDARPITYLVEVKETERTRPWYVKSVRKGTYCYTSDPLYAKRYNQSTAIGHMAKLISRGEM